MRILSSERHLFIGHLIMFKSITLKLCASQTTAAMVSILDLSRTMGTFSRYLLPYAQGYPDNSWKRSTGPWVNGVPLYNMYWAWNIKMEERNKKVICTLGSRISLYTPALGFSGGFISLCIATERLESLGFAVPGWC